MTSNLREIRTQLPVKDDELLDEDRHEIALGLGLEEARWLLENLQHRAGAVGPAAEFASALRWMLRQHLRQGST